MAQNLRDLRRELVLEAVSGPLCAVTRLFHYFGSILGPFWNPPGPILGQFGCFSVLFCSSIAFFAFLFFSSCFLVFAVDAVGVVGAGVDFGVVGPLSQACNAPNIKSSKLGTAECA